MPALDFHLRSSGMNSAQGWLYTVLYLHSNAALRCWPGDKLLKAEVHMTPPTIKTHRDFLIERGAIMLVPNDKRMTSEAHLPPKKYVYQLTGLYLKALPDVWMPTVIWQTPEALESHLEIIKNLEGEDALISKAYHALISKGLIFLPEVVPNAFKLVQKTPDGRDPIFDDLQVHLFKIALEVKVDQRAGARIGKVSAWCWSNEVSVEELHRFYSWYGGALEYAGCKLPLDLGAFTTAFLKFRSYELNKKQADERRAKNGQVRPPQPVRELTPEEQAEARNILKEGKPNGSK